jgi:hypothetical protein
MVAEDLPVATDALLNGNSEAVQTLVERDRAIDDLYPRIEDLVDWELVLQQPLASDLRFLVSVLRVVPELERSHDLVVNCARSTSRSPGLKTGFSEVLLYRNLHPMIAERLNLWRLSNFDLQRLPSAEDIYLFHAVAHETAKDERLIALAEVRDLTPARGAAGNIIGYPVLECQLRQSLADIRHALSGRPPKQRPVTNRVVLYVRPIWDIPTGTWRGLAHKLAPQTAGLGLEKVSVRVRTQDTAKGEFRVAVLDVENVADRAVSVRVRPPAGQPIRPLTEYKQSCCGHSGSARLIRTSSSARSHRRWAPRRPYGCNEAGVVVGVITNYTKLIPEGMHRVVILGDPTRGLGNLTENECRRILGAFDLAAEMDVPVEWFALPPVPASPGTAAPRTWTGSLLCCAA